MKLSCRRSTATWLQRAQRCIPSNRKKYRWRICSSRSSARTEGCDGQITSAVGVIARLTFREAARRWVVWVALALGLLFLVIYAIGFNEIEKDLSPGGSRGNLVAAEMHNFFLLAGLYVVNFLTSLMTVLTSVDTLSGEISSGTIHTVVSKPVPRWQIVLGKWLGFTGMLTPVPAADGRRGDAGGLSGGRYRPAAPGTGLCC